MNAQIGCYALEEVIGQSLCTIVYQARIVGTQQRVALKVLKPAFAEQNTLAQHFIACGRDSMSLQHPALAKVYDYGRSEGFYFIARQAVTGTTLAQRMVQQISQLEPVFTLEEILAIASQVAAALQSIHQDGHLHGNLKPSNILFSEKIFLSEKSHDHPPPIALCDSWGTSSRLLLHPADFPNANPAYFAPEQMQGTLQGSPSSDLYSLALILCQLFAGSPPFLPQDDPALLIETTLDQLKLLDAQEGSNFAFVLRRALSPTIELRYPSAAAFAEALLGARYNRIQTLRLGETALYPIVPVANPAVPPIERVPARPRLLPSFVWVIGGGLFLLLVLLRGAFHAIDGMTDSQAVVQRDLPRWIPPLPFTLTDHWLHYVGFALAMLTAIFLFQQEVVRVSKGADDLREDKGWGSWVAVQLLMIFGVLVVMRLFDLVG